MALQLPSAFLDLALPHDRKTRNAPWLPNGKVLDLILEATASGDLDLVVKHSGNPALMAGRLGNLAEMRVTPHGDPPRGLST